MDAIERALKSPRKRTVLLIGPGELWPSGPEELFPGHETKIDRTKIDRTKIDRTKIDRAKIDRAKIEETEIEETKAGGDGGLEKFHIPSMSAFNEIVGEISPSLVVCNSLNPAAAAGIRRHPLTAMTPIVMVSGRIEDAGAVAALSQYSRLIICHRAAGSSPEFRKRLRALAGGERILPPHTGVLVKKAILYFDRYGESPVSRWKLADTINVSEDYLTRIFHREMGLSPWDYLNRYRIFLAAELLRQTDRPIQDIALRAGFQDHAYFSRVFKKIYGLSPGRLRKR
jgi:AraC-like DNA-binding protein